MNRWTLEAYINNALDKRGELGRTAECAVASCYNNYRIIPIAPMNSGIKFGQRF